MIINRGLSILIFVLLCAVKVNSGPYAGEQEELIPWVENTLEAMSLDEKIGQLIMIRAFSKKDIKDKKSILAQIRRFHVGGICFFQGDPTIQADLTNTYQQKSKVPLFIAIDGEWGLGMRFPESTISYPRQLMLGAIQDNNLIYEMGRQVAKEMKRIGIHINFAPVVDVNNNPLNPVINDRSFGEDKLNVAAKSYAYMKGMQDEGLMACAKHFPGHGDTDVDSHVGLPIINYDRDRLDSLELMPFRELTKQGIESVMVAHLHLPKLDNRPNRPSTLSADIVNGILREEMNYDGLVFTDAMEMKGVASHFPNGIAGAEALLAGNDVILLPNDIAKTVETIKAYIKEGKLTEDRIDQSVRRVLTAKYKKGLNKLEKVGDLKAIKDDINSNEGRSLKAKLIENAITLVRDDSNKLPLGLGTQNRYAVLSIGEGEETAFQKRFSDYATTRILKVKKDMIPEVQRAFLNELKQHENVIVSLHDMSKYASRSFGIPESTRAFINELIKVKDITLVVFGSPYALKYFDNVGTVVLAYNEDEMTQDITAQSLFGANDIKGLLPVTASPYSRYGKGLYRSANGTLGYGLPEQVGLNSKKLRKIDTLMQEMQDIKAAPGGQVLVARNGKIIWNKSYGYHTYEKKRKVLNNDIYDVASVTKVMASTLSLMKLYDEGKLDLRSPLRRYIPETDTCDKRDIIIEDMLAHQARLAGWIPFYKKTVSENRNPKPLEKYYSKNLKPEFSIAVASNLFLRSDYQDSIWSRILASELREKDNYRYSDLAFYFAHKMIRNITKVDLDEYADDQFYKRMGLINTGFLPLRRHPKSTIAPTEEDNYFRKQRLQGYVHDMGAAMLGGVSGHAGLFSNASDLGVLSQMLLNGGKYGGVNYLSESTVKRFTSRYYRSTRRGIGFDMKEMDKTKTPNMCEEASEETFGHLGFTGTAVFIDPKYDLVYVFLSNRTYPNMKNNKLGRENIRPRVQSAIYQSFLDSPQPQS
jgi:beta-N-acetylhexosaminidase